MTEPESETESEPPEPELETPDEEELEELGEAFFALSSPRRLKILHLLTKPRYREELAEELDISRQGVSQHLDKLTGHGFIDELEGWRESGPVQEFRVAPQRLYALGQTLADLGTLEPEDRPEAIERPEPTQPLEADIDPPEPEGDAAHLLILDGPREGERFALEGEGPRWTLGRAEERDLTLDHDPYISSHQCEIQVAPDGYAVVDTYSSNGTIVNFARLPEGGRTGLEPGDVVRVGRTDLVFQQG